MNYSEIKNFRPLTLSALALAVSACAATSVEEAPPSAELAPMEKPVIAKNLRVHEIDTLKDEERYYDFFDAKENGVFSGRNKDGCSWDTSGDWVSPAVLWEGCGKDPDWLSGENRDMVKKGEIWPLAVGNKVSYSFNQINAAGVNTGRKTRICKVSEVVNIDVAAGNLDTYKVVCRRSSGSWSQTQTFYFSPETRSVVKFIRSTSSDGITWNTEFLRYEQL